MTNTHQQEKGTQRGISWPTVRLLRPPVRYTNVHVGGQRKSCPYKQGPTSFIELSVDYAATRLPAGEFSVAHRTKAPFSNIEMTSATLLY